MQYHVNIVNRITLIFIFIFFYLNNNNNLYKCWSLFITPVTSCARSNPMYVNALQNWSQSVLVIRKLDGSDDGCMNELLLKHLWCFYTQLAESKCIVQILHFKGRERATTTSSLLTHRGHVVSRWQPVITELLQASGHIGN